MKHFYVISNKLKDPSYNYANRIKGYIESRNGICVCQQLEKKSDEAQYNYSDASLIPKETECVVVLGGDGTLLQAARDINETNLPILGVNIGTLGFLTDTDMSSVETAIDTIMEDNHEIDCRMMLSGTIYRDDRVICEDVALNDIVINRSGKLRVIEFDIAVNGNYLCSYSADGVIVSTATGSTAYSLSAGGPIIQPNAELIMITPVCPHTLNKRSLIFGANDEIVITMGICKNNREERIATFDGEESCELFTGDRIVIKRSNKVSRLIKTNKDSFLQRVSEKMR